MNCGLRFIESETGVILTAAALRNNRKFTSFNDGIAYYLGYSFHCNMCAPTTTCTERNSTDASTNSANKETLWTGQNKSSFVKCFVLVVFMSVFMIKFSLWLPFVIPGVSSAALDTYVPAWYHYDDEHSRYDNTPWTYGTDYLLTVVMSIIACLCLRASSPDNCPKKNRASLKLRLYSASLLICYGISTLAGGWSHQHFTSIDSLNTTKFRLFWIVCVGNVCFGSCYMGLIGREVQKVFGVQGALPMGPWWFWPLYGSYMLGACALGYISYKRPACDIFIAGISQFPTTGYCILALGLRRWPSSRTVMDTGSKDTPIDLVRLPYRIIYYIGFIGNAPLLPMYPLLVQYSGMSLAGINTLLHTWLMVMWGMQGLGLLHICKAISACEPKAAMD